MARGEVSSSDYEQHFEVSTGGRVHGFDSLECVIHRLAPTCEHCGCQAIGHGVQADSRIFCASCATAAGVTGIRDHA